MSFAFDLKDRAVAQGVGTFGVNIFIGSKALLPPLGAGDATNGNGPYLSITESGGSGPDTTQNGSSVENPTAQLLARATSYDDALAMLLAIYAALGGADGLTNIVISGTTYLRIRPRQKPPIDVGTDGVGRPMLAFNVEAKVKA